MKVHQAEPYIEHRWKREDGLWVTQDLRGMESVLRLWSLDLEIVFEAIYEGVDFDISPET